MRKWLKRFAIGILATLAIILAGIAVSFGMWSLRHHRSLVEGSQVATTARGQVEYATMGTGLPVLMFHGTPGGYDQVLASHQADPEALRGQRTIAVSRPGYLRTPLSSGATFEAQADLFAALLDELGIEQVVAFAGSGGGYVGIQFALRHPQRTQALILYAPSIDPEHFSEDEAPDRGFLPTLRTDVLIWLARGPLLSVLAPTIVDGFNADDPGQREIFGAFVASGAPARARADGILNDLRQRDDPGIAEWPLEEIRIPTLILHGNADENSSYASSVRIAGQIPDADLVTFEGGGHFINVTRADEVRTHIQRFLESL